MSDRLQEAASGRTGPNKGFSAWIGGRCRRREYWAWAVPLAVLTFVLGMTEAPGASLIAGVPMLMIWIRRLHDLGRSGWFAPLINVCVNVVSFAAMAFIAPDAAALVALLIYVAALVVLGAIPGEPRTNAYGPPRGKIGDVAETFS